MWLTSTFWFLTMLLTLSAPLWSLCCQPSAFTWTLLQWHRTLHEEFCYDVSSCNKVVRYSLAYLSVRKDLWGTSQFNVKILANTDPPPCKTPIFARSASAVTPGKKLSVRWPVNPKPTKGGSNPQNGRFLCKIALRLKKVWYDALSRNVLLGLRTVAYATSLTSVGRISCRKKTVRLLLFDIRS